MVVRNEILMLPIWLKAPCRPDGQVNSDGQEETKEGSCRCGDYECCVDGGNYLIPRRILPEVDLTQYHHDIQQAIIELSTLQ